MFDLEREVGSHQDEDIVAPEIFYPSRVPIAGFPGFTNSTQHRFHASAVILALVFK
jgi:hypothetical protein